MIRLWTGDGMPPKNADFIAAKTNVINTVFTNIITSFQIKIKLLQHFLRSLGDFGRHEIASDEFY